MTSFLNLNFSKTSLKKFITLACFAIFLTDLVLLYYINQIIIPRLMSVETISQVLISKGISPTDFGQLELNSFRELLITTAETLTLVFIPYNIFFYIMAVKNKLWAKNYLKYYLLSTVLLSIIELITSFFTTKVDFTLFTVVTTISYFTIYLALKRHQGFQSKEQ